MKSFAVIALLATLMAGCAAGSQDRAECIPGDHRINEWENDAGASFDCQVCQKDETWSKPTQDIVACFADGGA